ncbi:MAG: outer membrane protein assembly factor BamB [Cycloclasticus sp. symbiont of Poecilosclerida sp. M]|nr:MAG: outer membrane protein assembly factor BamB [Cycloclasticus sp. symbiont of Poecilosclerida sp. M]
MSYVARFVFTLLPLLLLTACAGLVDATKSASKSLEGDAVEMLSFSSEDESRPPKELEDISNEVVLAKLWQEKLSAGQGDRFLKLEMVSTSEQLFIADHKGRVVALDRQTGEKDWAVETNLPISGGIGLGDGYLFFGTTDAEAVALSFADGKRAWISQVSSEVLSVPRYENNIVIFRSIDGAIAALDALDGKELWSFVRDVPALSLRGTSSPVLKSGGVIAGYANGQLVVLRLLDGLQIWQTSVAIPRGRGALSRMVDVDSDPLAGDEYIYAATFNGGMAAVEIRTGKIAWRQSELSSFKQMASNWSSIFVVDIDDHIWSADQETGGINWQMDKLEHRRLSPAAIVDDVLLTADYEGYLHMISVSDGHLMGRIKVSNAPVVAAPLVDGGFIFVQDINGQVTALQFASEEASED